MTKEGFRSARCTKINLAPQSVRKRKPPAIFKDLIEKPSVLVGIGDAKNICAFISNSRNDEGKRVEAINSLKNAVLIPETYDSIQRALSRLSTDPSENVKIASKNTFVNQRDQCMAVCKLKNAV